MNTFAEAIENSNLDTELYFTFMEKLNDAELSSLEKLVDAFCYNYIVGVSVKMYYTHDIDESKKFYNEIRISGKLEKKDMKENATTPEGFKNQYRILVDDSNYCYFSLENIVEFGTYGINSQFKGGQHLCLCLKF